MLSKQSLFQYVALMFPKPTLNATKRLPRYCFANVYNSILILFWKLNFSFSISKAHFVRNWISSRTFLQLQASFNVEESSEEDGKLYQPGMAKLSQLLILAHDSSIISLWRLMKIHAIHTNSRSADALRYLSWKLI